jgi:amino acid adenylation domain-containing protein
VAHAPASRKEAALWLLEKMFPGSAVNNLSLAFAFEGRLDLNALQNSLTLMMQRHSALRTTFLARDGDLIKSVSSEFVVAMEFTECDDVNAEDILTAFVSRPFNLSEQEALVRSLVVHGTQKDYFCLAVHHLVFDTISGAVLLEELSDAYNSFIAQDHVRLNRFKEEVVPLSDRVPTEASTSFWRKHLAGFDPGNLELWLGEPDTATPSLQGDHVLHRISPQTREAVRRMQKKLRCSESVILLAAYYLLLARHGAGPDLTIGTPMNIRDHEESRAIGYHINVLPLRVTVDFEWSFTELASQVRRVFMDAIAHADSPIEEILKEFPREISSWRTSLFRHAFSYVPGEGLVTFHLAGKPAAPIVTENGYSKFDLEFIFLASRDALDVRAAFRLEAFARKDITALLERYEQLLADLDANTDGPIGKISIFSRFDRKIVNKANENFRPARDTVILDDVRAQALRYPEAIALDGTHGKISYGQMWHTALQIADSLRTIGVEAGDVVALLGPRSPELAAAVFGVWLAGAAYLPLDPSHPMERLRHQLNDSRAKAVLTPDPTLVPDAAGRVVLTLAQVPASATEAVHNIREYGSPDPAACAYLIYTSGSTGAPKGTLISHRSLVNLVEHFADQLGITSADSMLWLTTFSFDISALELLLPLVQGGRVVIAPDQARTDGKTLADAITRYQVDTVQATPTTWRLVLKDTRDALSTCQILCGGEPLPRGLAQLFGTLTTRAWNVYGPTETTIWSTAGPIRNYEAGPVNVGRPITNTRVFIADLDGRELPVGVLGELCIAGEGVAIGYHDRPDLNEVRFANHPQYGRFYRTGDLARWLPDGTLQVSGRTDRQVKLNGNRVELAEVEAILLGEPSIHDVAAVVADSHSGDEILVAFVQASDHPELIKRLRERARSRLPFAAVPSAFYILDVFPMTGNDKIDYRALSRIARDRITQSSAATVSTDDNGRDPLLATLVSLWRELLRRNDVDRETNFFASGGHSLLCAQLAQRIEEIANLRVAMADIFTHPTPQGLADFLS